MTAIDVLVTDTPILQYKIRFNVEGADRKEPVRSTYTAQPAAFESTAEIYAVLEATHATVRTDEPAAVPT